MKFIDWVWGGACAGVGVFEFARGEPLDGFVCVGVGIVLTVLLAWLRAADKPKERDSILTLPSPPPPGNTVNAVLSSDSTVVEPHRLGSRVESCSYCRNWKERNAE